jgi:hypothetical protein
MAGTTGQLGLSGARFEHHLAQQITSVDMTRLPMTGLRQIAEINELVGQYRDRGFVSAVASWWQAEPAGDLQLFRRKTI